MGSLLTIVLLVLAAMVLVLLEVLTPSFGLLAMGAVGAIVAAVYVAFAYSVWLGYMLLVVVAVFGPIYVAFMVRLLPKTPLGRRLFLSRPPDATGQAAPEADIYHEMIGLTGTAETLLRPGGMVRIRSKRIPARAEVGVIEKDTPIVVVGADSMNVIVRKADVQA